MNTQETIIARIAEFEISERDLDSQYRNMMDECTPEVRIGSLRYSPAQVLEAVDPTAYRCGFVDWLDSESDRVVEIGGCYYDRHEITKALDEWLGELDAELESDVPEGEDDDSNEDAGETIALREAVQAFIKSNL